jgi:hypothetical protein
MSKLVFNKTTLNGFVKIPKSYPLPGNLNENSISLITRILIEQYSIYVEVLKWDLNKKDLLHVAAIVWKNFRKDLYKFYLDDNFGYEKLIGNLVKFAEYADDYLNDSFFEYCTLLNPFINKKYVSKKQQTEISRKREEERIQRIRVSKSKTAKMPLIDLVIKEMEESGMNFNRAVRIHSTSQDYLSDKSTISSWADNQTILFKDNLISDNSEDYIKAQKLIDFKEKNKRNQPKQVHI